MFVFIDEGGGGGGVLVCFAVEFLQLILTETQNMKISFNLKNKAIFSTSENRLHFSYQENNSLSNLSLVLKLQEDTEKIFPVYQAEVHCYI